MASEISFEKQFITKSSNDCCKFWFLETFFIKFWLKNFLNNKDAKKILCYIKERRKDLIFDEMRPLAIIIITNKKGINAKLYYLLYIRLCPKDFILSPQNHKWGQRGSERWSHLPRVVWIVKGRTGIQAANLRGWMINPTLEPAARGSCPIHPPSATGVAFAWSNFLSLSLLLWETSLIMAPPLWCLCVYSCQGLSITLT